MTASIFDRRPALRWAVPALATAAVIGGGAAVGSIAASAGAGLPERSAAQLLVDVQQAYDTGLSGTVVQRANLGLPDLPIPGGQGSTDFTSLTSGTHTMRVWYAGPDQARLALLGTFGESDVIRNGTDLWTWDSRKNTATHRTLQPTDAHKTPAADASALPRTPQEAADLALKALDPTTKVSTDGTARVAGRSAYELVLQPRDTSSLVGSVRLAIDGARHVPLRVQVYAKGATSPAFEVTFTQVSFARPDATEFHFAPPPGAQVTEAKPQMTAKPEQPRDGANRAGAPTVLGTGWTTVVVAKMPTAAGNASPKGEDRLTRILERLPAVSGSWGSGHLLSAKLFSVLVTDDGRVIAGAVAPQRLYQAAAGR